MELFKDQAKAVRGCEYVIGNNGESSLFFKASSSDFIVESPTQSNVIMLIEVNTPAYAVLSDCMQGIINTYQTENDETKEQLSRMGFLTTNNSYTSIAVYSENKVEKEREKPAKKELCGFRIHQLKGDRKSILLVLGSSQDIELNRVCLAKKKHTVYSNYFTISEESYKKMQDIASPIDSRNLVDLFLNPKLAPNITAQSGQNNAVNHMQKMLQWFTKRKTC